MVLRLYGKLPRAARGLSTRTDAQTILYISFHICLIFTSSTYFFQIHLVHFKSKYGSIENANKFTDGRAVVAIFYKVVLQYMYSKICLKRPLKKKTQKMIFNTDYMSSLQCHSVPSTIAQVLRKMSLKILAS